MLPRSTSCYTYSFDIRSQHFGSVQRIQLTAAAIVLQTTEPGQAHRRPVVCCCCTTGSILSNDVFVLGSKFRVWTCELRNHSKSHAAALHPEVISYVWYGYGLWWSWCIIELAAVQTWQSCGVEDTDDPDAAVTILALHTRTSVVYTSSTKWIIRMYTLYWCSYNNTWWWCSVFVRIQQQQ